MRKWRYFAVLILLCLSFTVTTQVQAEGLQEQEAAERMKKATELGLEEWVDQDGFLVDAFFEGKSDAEISNMSLDGLVKTMTEEEVLTFVKRLREGISVYTVTKYLKVSQVNPYTGRVLYAGFFEVDGRVAYCIQRDVTTPPQGSTTSEWIAVENDDIRKVLYHGYNGPAAKGYTIVETAMAIAEANGRGDNSLGRAILAEIQLLELPPEHFLAWKVETNGGTTQELAFYTFDIPKGKLSLKKVSGNPSITEGNSDYSLAEAEYGVYSDSSCSDEVGYLVTDENGISNEIELEVGEYYVKELAAPKGYLLNETVEKVTVVAGETIQIETTDDPIEKISLELIKYCEDMVLPGATFRHLHPDGTEEIAITDENGRITWEELQKGVHLIEEIEAPDGYLRNRNVIKILITEDCQLVLDSKIENEFGTVILEENQLKVENKIGYRLPNTGSSLEGVFYMAGICALILSTTCEKRRTI